MELSDEQKKRLEKLGDVTYFDHRAETPEKWLDRVKGFDVICTGKFGVKEKWNQLRNTFVSLPFVGVGWIDASLAKKHNVTIANSPGSNRHAVSEWIIAMMLLMSREIEKYLNVPELPESLVRLPTTGLAYKNITILGKGSVGSRVGEVAEALEMNVRYFQRGDNLVDKVKQADIVVDTLSSNPSTENLLNRGFFNALKNETIFITVTGSSIVDIDAMLKALNSGKLACVAHDAGGIRPGDTTDPLYQKLLKHPKVYLTPHIAWNTDVERQLSNDVMIENIEAWLKGKPIHVVGTG